MLNSHEKIEKLLWHIFDRRNLSDKHRKRLEWELREIDVQGKSDHLIKMFKDKVRCDGNENNLISFWLLGLCQEFDVDRDPKFTQGDMPDIDVDYLSEVRDYLKNKWACETFGVDYVCNIGNYTTFGIKSALIDMARVHGLPRGDMLELTKNLDAKDDEGKTMTWDAAMNLYPKLKEYCDANPDVAESARKLINRNRGMGQHAGGLIISSMPLHDLVPLVKRKDNPQASAWVEGLNGQDLQPVGLVKFDLLVISNLQQISSCCELVKKNHSMDSICALPGQSDWSDVQRWRNDPKALAMADVGDLKCIFQFDSEGIRRLVKSGGVDRFEDLVAYTALYRPGPLGMLMHERYTKRKTGEESYELHPIVQPILGDTYGVMVYQEQIMRILNKVGEIPLRDCEIVRKAISKKKVDAFQKYKNMFVSNGQRNLQTTEEDIVSLWNQVQAFSEYGFNKTVTEDTIIGCVDGQKEIKDVRAGDRVYCVNEKGQKEQTEVIAVHDHGVIDVVEVTFDDGYSVKCTLDHKFLTEEGQVPLWRIIEKNLDVLSSPLGGENAEKKRLGNKLWGNSSQQKKVLCTSEELLELQENLTTEENRAIQPQIALRNEIFDKLQTCRSSERMPEVLLPQMEEVREKAHFKVWHGISSFNEFGRTSSLLRKMHKNKEEKYSGKNGQVEQGQSRSRTQGDIFRNSQEDLCAERCAGGESNAIEKMERQQSKGICQSNRESPTFSEEIKNGIVAKKFFKLEAGKDTMWGRKKVCRFSQKEYLDRSGWTFSFLANRIKIRQEEAQPIFCSKQRSNTQAGMFEKKKCDLDKIEHDLFSSKDWSNEIRVVDFAPFYAPISDTGGLVRRRVLRAVPVGKRRCYDLEVSCSTHNFILPNGVVTSNSHAVAYSYVSARLLYFKAHYPHEFYTSVLGCETLSEKIKEYKIEAKNHGVDMHGVDINKSKSTFELVGGSIYYGLSNVKGIGQVPAKKIVDNQPYAGFEDFLTRFGTDANIVKCVVGLRCFSDSTPITLWKFYEHFKECQKKLDDKKKRFLASMEQYDVEFLELFPEETRSLSEFHGDSPFDGPEWAGFDIDEVIETEKTVECDQSQGKPKLEMEYVPIQGTDDFVEVQTIRNYKSIKVKKNWNRLKELKRLWSRRGKAMARLEESKSLSLPTLASFKPNDFEIDKDFAKELRNKVACEMKYYGFAWIHNVENSPDFKGNTFQTLRENDGCVCPVEIEVVSRKACKSKKGNSYLQLEVEDAMGEKNRLNVWEDDVSRWDREMKKGNLLRLRLMPPDKGFSTYTLEQNKKMPNKGWAYRFPTKDSDYRVFVMKPPVSAEDKYQTEDEVLEQFGNCIMEDKK